MDLQPERLDDGTYILKMTEDQYLLLKNAVVKYNKSRDCAKAYELRKRQKDPTKKPPLWSVSNRINLL